MKVIALRWLAVSATAGIVAVGGALAATTKTTVKPSNSSPPTISGDAVVGSKLTANPGTWDGSAPIHFQYQWLVCGASGEACSNINGETDKTFKVRNADVGNTIRVKVIAGNSDGSDTANSAATARVTAATTTTTPTTTTPTPPSGCPKNSGTINISDLQPPARLQFGSFRSNPSVITGSTQSFDLQVHVTSTCGSTPVSGVLVYATATPYNQFDIPPEGTTNASGNTTLRFVRGNAFPAARNQELLIVFMRARKESDPLLAGVSTRQLVSLTVNLSA